MLGCFQKVGGGGKKINKSNYLHILPLWKKKKERQQPRWQLLLIGNVEGNLSGTEEMLRRQSVKHEQRAQNNQPSSFSSFGIFMKGEAANAKKKKKKELLWEV